MRVLEPKKYCFPPFLLQYETIYSQPQMHTNTSSINGSIGSLIL